ncbi:hypothetical protein [Cellulomonas sp. P5_C5]
MPGNRPSATGALARPSLDQPSALVREPLARRRTADAPAPCPGAAERPEGAPADAASDGEREASGAAVDLLLVPAVASTGRVPSTPDPVGVPPGADALPVLPVPDVDAVGRVVEGPATFPDAVGAVPPAGDEVPAAGTRAAVVRDAPFEDEDEDEDEVAVAA